MSLCNTGAGQLRRALACLTAMSAGATERSQLSSLPCWRRAASEHVPLTTSPRAPPAQTADTNQEPALCMCLHTFNTSAVCTPPPCAAELDMKVSATVSIIVPPAKHGEGYLAPDKTPLALNVHVGCYGHRLS